MAREIEEIDVRPAQEVVIAEEEQQTKGSRGRVKVAEEKKLVKIRAMEDIDCLIACKPYTIGKDKEVSVPTDVAAILCFAKKAYRL